jgi:uncharacterized damage-inducible protein DinB
MAQQTMTEKDQYLQTAEREYEVTLKILKAYPPDKLDIRASERGPSAREIAWTCALGHMVTDAVIKGDLSGGGGGMPKPPATLNEIIAAFEQSHRDRIAKVSKLTEADFNQPIRMPTGPKQVGEVRRGTVLWMFLHDQIHHRGQLSVYLRMAGAKVPSIYGPSGDEPWS